MVTNSQGKICWAVLLKAEGGLSLNSPLSSFLFLLLFPLPIFFPSLSFPLSVLTKFHHPEPVASRLFYKQVYGFPGWQLSSVLSSTSHCTPSCFCDHFSLTGNGIRGSAVIVPSPGFPVVSKPECLKPESFLTMGNLESSLSYKLNGFSKACSGHTETGRRFDKTFWILLAFSSAQKKTWFGKVSFRSALRGVLPPSVMFCSVFMLVCVEYLWYLCFLRDLLSLLSFIWWGKGGGEGPFESWFLCPFLSKYFLFQLMTMSSK